MNTRKQILIVGLFLSETNKKRILRTAADQLAELLRKHNYQVITVSTQVNQVLRFVDTMLSIVANARKYTIAIVPLYGGFKSYLWESISSRLLKLLGKKVILVVHGGSIPGRMQNKTELNRYLSSFRRADLIVCPSKFIANTIAQHGKSPVILKNVVNLDDYVFQSKERFRPRLFWMRTLEDIYNPEMAVRVLAILKEKYHDASMVMAGYDRGSLQLVKKLAAELNVTDRIELPGYITNEQKNQYASSQDIYICTNRIDNAPVTFIEMMAMGLPIVSVDVGGIPYLLEQGVNGLMVGLDEDKLMAEAISSIIENPTVGRQLANNGAAFAKNFGEAVVIKKWEKAFEQL